MRSSNDESPDAWEKLVDRLLDDKRYGEHWARYWLDLVRFAESDGWNQDAFRPYLWRYRDYVVNSFNNDKPYPEFVRQQLAGDEIREDNPEHSGRGGLLAAGHLRVQPARRAGHWNDIMNEITDVTADVFLGMGMAVRVATITSSTRCCSETISSCKPSLHRSVGGTISSARRKPNRQSIKSSLRFGRKRRKRFASKSMP